MGLGVIGAGYASSLSHILNLMLLSIVASFQRDIKEAFFWPGRESFTGLWDYLKIALPSGGLVCLAWWAYELMTLLAGYLTVEETAAQVVIMNLMFLSFSCSFGISVAASVMVGNNIGSGKIAQAKKYGKVYQLYGLMQSVLVCSLMIILSDLIASTFTSIAEV
jgi:multidrug resistance protein, MATE family